MRILTVQHQADAPAGLVGAWLASRGVRLQVVRPDLGVSMPGSLEGYGGMLVLGGSMGAYDDDVAPWLPQVRELLASAVRNAVPTLGICLGHQLLAAAAGGTIDRHPDGRQMGTVVLRREPEASDDLLFGALCPPYRAVRWHQDVVRTPPPDGRVLTTGDGDIHGIRVGDCAWGVQAHPEASAEIVQTWAERTEQQIVDAQPPHADPSPVANRIADVHAALADVRARKSELATVWRPVAEAFANRLLGASGHTDWSTAK